MDDQYDANKGLLTNKQKNMKIEKSGRLDTDIELQDLEEAKYISFDDAKEKTKFQQKPQKIAQPVNHESDILFQLDDTDNQHQSVIISSQQRPLQQQYQYNGQQQQNFRAPQLPNQQTLQRSQTQPILPNSNTCVATCVYCGVAQAIGDPKKPFQCYQCRNIVNAQFSYFTCGACKVSVMYQTDVSPIVKCTRCLTMNYIPQKNTQPPINSMMNSQYQSQFNIHQQVSQNMIPPQNQNMMSHQNQNMMPPQNQNIAQYQSQYQGGQRPPPQNNNDDVILKGEDHYIPIFQSTLQSQPKQ